jgi:uncharacterized Zn finger protein
VVVSWGYPPYRSAAERRADAARAVAQAARRGRPFAPVVIEGRKIATTFWGAAWCDNLERYRDFAYRLERGRSYVRSGAVVDLAVTPGRVRAKVSGSMLYSVEVDIDAVAPEAWRAIQADTSGSIGSLVDLLAGKLSPAVMARLAREQTGLFPAPRAIHFACSCPDAAVMCKHVAAVMYGIGARLDRQPELLFTLRQVSADELLASVAADLPTAKPAPAASRVLPVDASLAALFGIDLVLQPPRRRTTAASAPKPKPKRTPKLDPEPKTASGPPAKRRRAARKPR